MHTDESPSPEDLARFGHQSAYCSKCSEPVWDDANFCSECGEYFRMAVSEKIGRKRFKNRWRILLLVIGMITVALVFTLW